MAERMAIKYFNIQIKIFSLIFSMSKLQKIALDIREDVIDMIYLAGSGHPASCLSCVDIMVSLYFDGFLNYNPNDPARDRFVLSKGHAAPVLYAIGSRLGLIQRSKLKNLRKLSGLEGHVAYNPNEGIEASSGILGSGWAQGLGMALAGYKTVVLAGDGEFQEGICKETIEVAVQYKKGNLCIIIDNNGYQLDGPLPATLNIAKICESIGCDVIGKEWSAYEKEAPVVNGHDFDSLHTAFEIALKCKHEKPVVVIANTIKGKGVPDAEANPVKYHGEPLKGEAYKRAKELFAAERKRLGGWNYEPIDKKDIW
jgi:transketolase